jgi:two-component system CheB/CheR fusion protein
VPERQLLPTIPLDAAGRLLRVAHDLSLVRDISTVTTITGRAARDLTGADGITFVLREAEACFYADEEAIAPLWKGLRFPIDACISGWVMIHDSPAFIRNVYDDSRIPHDAYKPTFVRSLAMVPVRAPEPIAAIGAYWASEHDATEAEVGILRCLADSAALAIRNLQLYNELSNAVERETQARIAAETARAMAERAAATKDEFLALVAHELRQPLHASTAALRIMEARPSRESGEHARTVVNRQVVQMSRLVEDLLDAARIVRGHVQLDLSRTDLTAAVEVTADSLRPLVAERRHQFAVSVPEHPVIVRADAARLQQVFTNLVTNAAKYTDPGGQITFGLTTGNGRATVAVSDNGRGIDSAVLPGIFDLFTRGAPDVRGFGIGLAVTRRLVELHGGTIEARSAGAGHGSEFVVSLPLAADV